MVELLPGYWAVWISTRAPQLWRLTQGGWVLLSWSEIYGDWQGGCKKPRLHSRQMYTHTCLLPKHGRSSILEPWLPSARLSPCQAPPPRPPAPECSSMLGQRLPRLSKTLGREGQSQLGSGGASENKGAHHWSQGGKSGVLWSSDWCWDHPCTHPSPCQAPTLVLSPHRTALH